MVEWLAAWNDNAPSDLFVRSAKIVKVVDGDTLRVEIDQGFGCTLQTDVRLLGVDTPEPRGPEAAAGKFVTEQVKTWIACRLNSSQAEGATVSLSSHVFKMGEYGRCLCSIWCGDECLNSWLLERELAWVTDKSGSVFGQRDIERLRLPDGIKQQVREALA
jgi:micrococcal nuclease